MLKVFQESGEDSSTSSSEEGGKLRSASHVTHKRRIKTMQDARVPRSSWAGLALKTASEL